MTPLDLLQLMPRNSNQSDEAAQSVLLIQLLRRRFPAGSQEDLCLGYLEDLNARISLEKHQSTLFLKAA